MAAPRTNEDPFRFGVGAVELGLKFNFNFNFYDNEYAGVGVGLSADRVCPSRHINALAVAVFIVRNSG